MEIGWLVIHRELLGKPIWKGSTPEQKVVLMTLLMMVDFMPSEWEWQGKKYQTKPGEKITSINSIVEKAGKGISTQNVRSSLKRFEKLEFLTNKSTKTGRLISIINWDSYQEIKTEPNKDPTKTQQRPNKDPTPNEQGNKETREQKGKDIPAPPAPKTPKTVNPEILEFVEAFQAYIEKDTGFKATKAVIKGGCQVVDELIRLDDHSLVSIRGAMNWATRDSFWSGQVKSLAGLRKLGKNRMKKYENLLTEMNKKGKISSGSSVLEKMQSNCQELLKDTSWIK